MLPLVSRAQRMPAAVSGGQAAYLPRLTEAVCKNSVFSFHG
jgi:hypothetical protein